jgi:SAM-dependent methyltransferase
MPPVNALAIFFPIWWPGALMQPDSVSPTLQHCRVCQALLGQSLLIRKAPSLTSMLSELDGPTVLYQCEGCTHLQSPDLPDLHRFYDTDYKISLQSDDHDQLYAIVNDKPLYRTDHQANLVTQAIDLTKVKTVLDYGCAKADTLKKIVARASHLVPHVFDVSSDYQQSWQGWIKPEHQACYETPDHWQGRFDLITCHFVLEHVANPVAMLRHCASLLKDGGQLFLSVPDYLSNSGDMIVVDHLNHFTSLSLKEALQAAGLTLTSLEEGLYRGAFVVSAQKGEGSQACVLSADKETIGQQTQEFAHFWQHADTVLENFCASHDPAKPVAIYGAGFYGTYIAKTLGSKIHLGGFVDQNQHIQKTGHLGYPVFAPDQLPHHVQILLIGLNPDKARAIMQTVEAFKTRYLTMIYLQ